MDVITCEHCPRSTITHHVFVEMEPGPDGNPWWLCFQCWIDGRRRTSVKTGKDVTTELEAPPKKARKPKKAS